jgi:hypothetical protein
MSSMPCPTPLTSSASVLLSWPEPGQTVTALAKDLGIRESCLRNWMATPGGGSPGRTLNRLADRAKGRCRKLRYRGVAANDLWLHHRMAALK